MKSLSTKICLLVAIPVLWISASPAYAQEKTAVQESKRTKAVVQKNGVAAKANKEKKPAEVELTEYELVWPTFETHPQAFLTISGSKKKWTHLFADGEEPAFSPIEEKFEEGTYSYRIEYSTGVHQKERQASKEAFANRRALLKKRLALLEKGDRDGAKAALDQANKIRSDQANKKAPFGVEQLMAKEKKPSDAIVRVGRFVVRPSGKVAAAAEEDTLRRSADRGRSRESDDPENIEY